MWHCSGGAVGTVFEGVCCCRDLSELTEVGCTGPYCRLGKILHGWYVN